MKWTDEMRSAVARACCRISGPTPEMIRATEALSEDVVRALLSTPTGQRALVDALAERGCVADLCPRCKGLGYAARARCSKCARRGAVMTVPGEKIEALADALEANAQDNDGDPWAGGVLAAVRKIRTLVAEAKGPAPREER